MEKNKKIILGVIVAILIVGTIFAVFSIMEQSRKDQAVNTAIYAFNKYDTNNDNNLDVNELRTFAKNTDMDESMAEYIIYRYDIDRDGKINLIEFTSYAIDTYGKR